MTDDKQRATITIDIDALNWVDDQAKKENRSRSNMIECLIQRQMEREVQHANKLG